MEEDLVCIFNTVALFLEHQNFIKTCAVFRDECRSRGYNIRNKYPYKCSSEVADGLDQEEQHYIEDQFNNESSFSKALLEDGNESTEIAYNFKEEKVTAISEVPLTIASFETNNESSENTESSALMVDYLNLKEKFVDLQNQFSYLVGELEEKTRFLDHIISLLKRNQDSSKDENSQRVIPMLESSNSSNVRTTAPLMYRRSCEILEEKELGEKMDSTHTEETPIFQNSSTSALSLSSEKISFRETGFDPVKNGDIPSYCSENLQTDLSSCSKSPKNSSRNEALLQATVEDAIQTVSDENHKKSENSISELEKHEILSRDEVNFLFTRKKCHQTHSAPSSSIDNSNCESNLNHKPTHTCVSMPLSARKNLPYHQYFPLDFSKLKHDLTYGKSELRLLILQALRWRLTQSTHTERGNLISSYVWNDLLNLHSEISIVDVLSQDTIDEESVEGVSRLTNTIASLKQGRDYICSSEKRIKLNIISSLRKQLENCEKVSVSSEMLIVTLQKISIRKEQRKIMIQNGLLQSISKLLINRRNELSAYCLEYSLALFMNLCLEEEAKTKCAEEPSSIIKVFSCLLNEVQDNYMPYVTGALYSILSEKSVEEEALHQELDVLIFQQMKNTRDKYLRKQLEFIIRARFRGEGASFTCNENEPSEEIDMLEPELDENDMLEGPVQGENLLEIYKLSDDNLDQISNEKKENTSQTESGKITSAVEEGTNMDPNNSIRKIETARIKFDAEISTSSENLDTFQNTIPVSSLLEYAQRFRPDVLPQTLELCSCLGRAKYNCGCYEAIKRSVEEDEQIMNIKLTDTQIQPSGKIKNTKQLSLSAPESISNVRLEKCSPFVCKNFCKKS